MRTPKIIWLEIQAESIALQICMNETTKDFISIENISRKLSELFNELAELAHEKYLKEIVDKGASNESTETQ